MITVLTHVQTHLFVCEEHRGTETSYSRLKTKTNKPTNPNTITTPKQQLKKTKKQQTCKKNTHPPTQAINTHSYQQLHDLYVCMIRASRSTYHDKPSQRLPNCTCPCQGHFKKLSRLPGITSCYAGPALKHKCVCIYAYM